MDNGATGRRGDCEFHFPLLRNRTILTDHTPSNIMDKCPPKVHVRLRSEPSRLLGLSGGSTGICYAIVGALEWGGGIQPLFF